MCVYSLYVIFHDNVSKAEKRKPSTFESPLCYKACNRCISNYYLYNHTYVYVFQTFGKYIIIYYKYQIYKYSIHRDSTLT